MKDDMDRASETIVKHVTLLIVGFLLVGCASPAELYKANAQVSSLQAQNWENDSTISSLEAQVDRLTDTESGLQSEMESLQASFDKVQSERDNRKSKSDEDYISILALTSQINRLICADQIVDMKYTNILDASTILAAWWARQPGVERVGGTYRNRIWSNGDTKIHAIQFVSSVDHEPYIEHFLVYFDEFEMKPGVFWLRGQCWLDVP